VSATVEKRVDERGDAAHVEDAWTLKERIHHVEGVLKQRRGFFFNAYRRATCHLYYEDGALAGFAAARRDGYVLFLAVAPEHRGHGYGSRLIADVAERNRSVTCHVRASNDDAIAFYRHVGFELQRRIDDYYEDGGDAYYMKLGEPRGLTEKLSDIVRG